MASAPIEDRSSVHRTHRRRHLTNGVTRSETLAATFHGIDTYALDGSVHAAFEAPGTISRKNYGLYFNVSLGPAAS